MSKLIVLYQQMADHTSPECATNCRVPHSCCDEMYCAMAYEYAKTQGEILESTGHERLPFMSVEPGKGCTVPPHLRPLCTLHTCAINSLGVKPGDEAWTAKYFEIRDQIEREEEQEARYEGG